MQQVVGYLACTGRDADLLGEAAPDPLPTYSEAISSAAANLDAAVSSLLNMLTWFKESCIGAIANMTRHHLGSIDIRPATEADAATIAAIHTASWRDAYAHILAPEFLIGDIEADRLDVWSQRLRDRPPTQLVKVAFDSTGLAQAFVCVYFDFDPIWGSLMDNLHVRPLARGQGIGEQLFRTVAGQLSTRDSSSGLHLWVFEANVAGLRFYKRLGGRVVGSDNSSIPSAGGKTVLRVHWPTVAQIG